MKELGADEIKPGMIVTIIRWKGRYDRSWVGDLMNVEAVDLPFIVASGACFYKDRHTLNLNEVAVGQPNKEFIEAATGVKMP